IAFATQHKLEDVAVHFNCLKNELERDLTFNVLTLGDFSSGKSTFINSFFIKQALLPVKATPTTAKLTIIRYGEEHCVKIYLTDGTKKEFFENAHQAMKDYLLKGGSYVDQVDYVEIFINSEYLRHGIVIVDSPGLNDPEIERMKVTMEFIDRADSVLYLLTATQAWKKSEKDFLEQKIFRKEDLDKIFFLVNFWDMVDPQEREDLLTYIRNEMRKSVEKVSSELGEYIEEPLLIPISAKTGENFEVLERELWSYFTSKKGASILANKIKKFEKYKEQLEKLLREKLKLLEQEDEQLRTQLSQIEKDIEQLQAEVSEFRMRVGERVGREIDIFLSRIAERLDKVKKIAYNRIRNAAVSIEETAELKKVIEKSLEVAQFQTKRGNEAIIKDFCNRIVNILEEEKARFKLDLYDSSKGIDDISEIKSLLDSSIIEAKDDKYFTLQLVSSIGTGAFGIIAALAGANITILAPLAIVALGGLIYSHIKGTEYDKRNVLLNIEILRETLDSAFETKILELKAQKEELASNILNNMAHYLIDTLEVKKKTYEETLKRKANDTEKKISQELYTKAIEGVKAL
ncbi:MAG: dynamin family protein, partial [Candidatus Methanomethylicaceae archaeon]